MYAWGLCPFLGMEIYSKKSLAPRNLSGINLGTTPPVGTTHGDLAASPAVLVNESAFGRHLWFSLFPKKRAKDAKVNCKKV